MADRCRAVQQEPGCQQFEVFQSALDPDKLVALELWPDQAALDVHAQVNATQPPHPALAARRADDTHPRETTSTIGRGSRTGAGPVWPPPPLGLVTGTGFRWQTRPPRAPLRRMARCDAVARCPVLCEVRSLSWPRRSVHEQPYTGSVTAEKAACVAPHGRPLLGRDAAAPRCTPAARQAHLQAETVRP
jgi:quinol monooxygenase YgiN